VVFTIVGIAKAAGGFTSTLIGLLEWLERRQKNERLTIDIY